MTKPDIIKICGLSTPESVDAILQGGATHLGMIFFEKSPRHLEIETARKLAGYAGNRVKKVAVTVNASDEYLDQIFEATAPDYLQLHGAETPKRVAEIKERYGLPIIKAMAVKSASDLEHAKAYIGFADHFLFDAKAPHGSEIPGGNGVAFDWEVMDHWPQSVPYILSGGLDSGNISLALETLNPGGIDVSSGVESAPGIKDNEMIRDFLRIVG